MTGRSDRQILPALLAGVRAEPRSDLPRLAVADYLEERGEGPDLQRAAFIREQVALARFNHRHLKPPGRRPDCPKCKQLVCMIGRLERFRPAQMGWLGQPLLSLCLSQDPGGRKAFAEYRRGFVAGLTCLTEAWVEHGRAVCGQHPIEDVFLDRHARRFRSGGRACWAFALGQPHVHEWWVPAELFNLLRPDRVSTDRLVRHRVAAVYTNIQEAAADMGRAALAYGRGHKGPLAGPRPRQWPDATPGPV